MRQKHILLIGLLILLSLPVVVQAQPPNVNEFYRSFRSLMENGKDKDRELLVRQNRSTAIACFARIKERLTTEQDPRVGEALQTLARDLDELIAVTLGKVDCQKAHKIQERAKATRLTDDKAEALRRALALCPDHVEARLHFAETAKNLGRFDEAVAAYNKVLTVTGDDPVAWLGLGETLASAGLYQRAVPFLERSLGIHPTDRKTKALLSMIRNAIAEERDGLIGHEDLVRLLDRRWEGLMCMCPVHARLVARIRLREVTFHVDSAALDDRARAQLDELAKALKTEPLSRGRFLLEAHADNTGPADYNQRLSLDRAVAVEAYLVNHHGIDPALLSVAGAGGSRWWTPNATTEGRRSNRRLEIVRIEDLEQQR